MKNYYIFLVILIGLSFFASRFSPAPPQTHFVDLAYAFLQGQLHLSSPIRIFDDYALFHERVYVYFGPLPAILLTPLVLLFGQRFPQEALMPVFVVSSLFLLYRLARLSGLKKPNCLWLATFFIFGSVYLPLSITSISSYQTQIIGVTFLLLALHEFLTRKRWVLIGLFIALAGLTRQTLFLAAVFFFLEILRGREQIKIKLKTELLLLISLLVAFILLGFYNFARFENPFENGYAYNATKNPIYTASRSEGFFSLKHVPGNLFFFLFKGPEPIRQDNLSYILKPPYIRVSEWGLSIFLTSPLFIYLLLARLKEKYNIISAFLTVIAMLIPVLTYAGVGVWQYGYRYALDFYPFLFLILLSIFQKGLPLIAKGLIVYSIIFTLIFMYSIWGIYPFLPKNVWP